MAEELARIYNMTIQNKLFNLEYYGIKGLYFFFFKNLLVLSLKPSAVLKWNLKKKELTYLNL
jgi:hypothetical protein